MLSSQATVLQQFLPPTPIFVARQNTRQRIPQTFLLFNFFQVRNSTKNYSPLGFASPPKHTCMANPLLCHAKPSSSSLERSPPPPPLPNQRLEEEEQAKPPSSPPFPLYTPSSSPHSARIHFAFMKPYARWHILKKKSSTFQKKQKKEHCILALKKAKF